VSLAAIARRDHDGREGRDIIVREYAEIVAAGRSGRDARLAGGL
jgi:hypothetical protein